MRWLCVLGGWSAKLDLPAAAMILGGFLLATAILTTVVTLTLALSYESGPAELGALLDPGGPVIASANSSAPAN